MTDSYGARSTLQVSGREYEIHRLDALQSKFDVARLPVLAQGPARELPPARGRFRRHGRRRRDHRHLGREGRAVEGDPLPAGARPDAGLHRRPRRRRPRRDARRDGRARFRPGQDQPARPRRPRHRPLGPGRRLRQCPRLRRQRRARVRAQRGALRVPALGPEGVRQLPRRPARDRHLPSGQPRAPRQGRLVRREGRRPERLPRHARRHRLPHDDDQRPQHPRLGRRRDRGGGGHARPADLDAAAAGDRLPARRRARRRDHGDRPRPAGHRDAARARRRQQVRRVLRSRACRASASPTGPPSATCRRSSARPARSSRRTRRRSATSSSPAAAPR